MRQVTNTVTSTPTTVVTASSVSTTTTLTTSTIVTTQTASTTTVTVAAAATPFYVFGPGGYAFTGNDDNPDSRDFATFDSVPYNGARLFKLDSSGRLQYSVNTVTAYNDDGPGSNIPVRFGTLEESVFSDRFVTFHPVQCVINPMGDMCELVCSSRGVAQNSLDPQSKWVIGPTNGRDTFVTYAVCMQDQGPW